jgi:hypothetical protein
VVIPYAFVPHDSPTIASLAATLERRAATQGLYVPPLPNASLITRRVVPRVDVSEPSLQHVIHQFVAALGEPYRSRVQPWTSFASPLSLDQAELRLGGWLVGGLASERAIFDDAPDAGWELAVGLLVALDEPSGARFYQAPETFKGIAGAFQQTLFAVSADRVTMVYVFGQD